ncbi:MAG: NAD-dependent epimerase/dehydratase family protein [Syntrophorhabdaceae bacterium]|nr:NAD-dependent epimerase/dehydratase family protein [Syntrophorhabdaceae bacterium]
MNTADFYRGRKVLVAGGTGTIGIPVAARLVEHGADVHIVSMDSEDYARRVLPEGASFERLDLTQLDNCLAATRGYDCVFNMVGIKGSVGIGQKKVASYLVPMLWFQTNLMEASFRNQVKRFLYVGSICEYPRAEVPKREDTVWDGMPLQNDRIPGLAKRIGEVQAEAYMLEHGWDAVRIVRPSNVYGPYDDFNPSTAQVIPAIIRRVIDGENPLRVWGDGTVRRDFIYSEDLADWLLVALDKAPPCVPLNLGCGRGISIREVAETVCACANSSGSIEWRPEGPTGDQVRILSIEKARDAIGFQPQVSLEEGIKKTISWFMEHRDLADLKGR